MSLTAMASGVGLIILDMVTSEVEAQVHSGCVLKNIHVLNYVLMFEGTHTPIYLTEVSLAPFSDTLCERVLVLGRISGLLNAQSSSAPVAFAREH